MSYPHKTPVEYVVVLRDEGGIGWLVEGRYAGPRRLLGMLANGVNRDEFLGFRPGMLRVRELRRNGDYIAAVCDVDIACRAGFRGPFSDIVNGVPVRRWYLCHDQLSFGKFFGPSPAVSIHKGHWPLGFEVVPPDE